MFCPHKNSYLQLTTSVDPKLINKAVRRAMRKTQFDPHDEYPPAQRMMSMQPSLYAPWLDITRKRLGFERLGLRNVYKDINSDDSFIKLQAIHTIMDQVRISENAILLIELNVVYRLIALLEDPDPIVREKVCIILTHLGNYFQGTTRILSQPIVVDRLMYLFMRDRKEIRYAAANCFKSLTRYRYGCDVITNNNHVIKNLLYVIKKEHAGIVILHLETLKNLTDLDPTKALKANGFQIMWQLMTNNDARIAIGAMECMTQLCKHSIGKKLADMYDLTRILLPYLYSPDLNIVISAVGLMVYTSITAMSKWRIKGFSYELSRRLTGFCVYVDVPVLQLRAMQVMINMCDCSEFRLLLRNLLEEKVNSIEVRKPEHWDGTTDTNHYGVDMGHYYRTRYIGEDETIRVDLGDNVEAINVNRYLEQVKETKERLIKKMNSDPYKD